MAGAEAIRREHQYAVPPVERGRVAATRRLLAGTGRVTVTA